MIYWHSVPRTEARVQKAYKMLQNFGFNPLDLDFVRGTFQHRGGQHRTKDRRSGRQYKPMRGNNETANMEFDISFTDDGAFKNTTHGLR